MTSEKKIQASKANGARSRGPITEQGKRNSSRNSIRHGLLAQTVVLEEESTERFEELFAGYLEEYQPTTVSQVSLVETMAVARWRPLRVWGAQNVRGSRHEKSGPQRRAAPVRALAALKGLPETAFCFGMKSPSRANSAEPNPIFWRSNPVPRPVSPSHIIRPALRPNLEGGKYSTTRRPYQVIETK